MKHETAHDRHENIKRAIMATDSNGSAIYIDLLTIADSTEEIHANYQIKHGNYFPASEGGKATWDQFYIDGKDDGFPDGFLTIEDVVTFIDQEIERINEKKTKSILSNENTAMGVKGFRWSTILEAWINFRNKLHTAIKAGKIVDVTKAKQMRNSMYN